MQGTATRKRRKVHMTRTSFLLPEDMLERFRDVASAEHRTLAAELRRLIELRIAEAEAKDDEPVGAAA